MSDTPDNVTPLQLHTRQINDEVVDHLEELLERAQAGEINALVYVVDTPHELTADYAGTLDSVAPMHLLGCATRLLHTINCDLDARAYAQLCEGDPDED